MFFIIKCEHDASQQPQVAPTELLRCLEALFYKQFLVFCAHFFKMHNSKALLNEAYVYFRALSFLSSESEYRTRNNERRRIRMFRHSIFVFRIWLRPEAAPGNLWFLLFFHKNPKTLTD